MKNDPGRRREPDEKKVDLSKGEFGKRYDLVDDSTPEPANVAPSDDAPAANPFAPPPEEE